MAQHMARLSRPFECGYCDFVGQTRAAVVTHSADDHPCWPLSIMDNQPQESDTKLTAAAPDVTAAAPDLTAAAPDVIAAAPDVIAAAPDVPVAGEVKLKSSTARKHTAPSNKPPQLVAPPSKTQQKPVFRCLNCGNETMRRGEALGHCRGRHRVADVVTMVEDFYLSSVSLPRDNAPSGCCSLQYRCARCHHVTKSRSDVVAHARREHGAARIIEKRRWHRARGDAATPDFHVSLVLRDVATLPRRTRFLLLRKHGVRRAPV